MSIDFTATLLILFSHTYIVYIFKTSIYKSARAPWLYPIAPHSLKQSKNYTNIYTGKLYASSAFFTPGLHPTVEDQFEMARMISSSLCDSSNQKSKGQSMYVNRKKRSVKWVHEGTHRAPPYSAPICIYPLYPVLYLFSILSLLQIHTGEWPLNYSTILYLLTYCIYMCVYMGM